MGFIDELKRLARPYEMKTRMRSLTTSSPSPAASAWIALTAVSAQPRVRAPELFSRWRMSGAATR